MPNAPLAGVTVVEDVLVPRGAIGFAGDTDACSMEVPVLGG